MHRIKLTTHLSKMKFPSNFYIAAACISSSNLLNKSSFLWHFPLQNDACISLVTPCLRVYTCFYLFAAGYNCVQFIPQLIFLCYASNFQVTVSSNARLEYHEVWFHYPVFEDSELILCDMLPCWDKNKI